MLHNWMRGQKSSRIGIWQLLCDAEEAGGLSGAPVLDASNRLIRQLRAALGKTFPIIGGGVMSGADAFSKISAGDDVRQMYTGLIYKGPELVREATISIKKSRWPFKNVLKKLLKL